MSEFKTFLNINDNFIPIPEALTVAKLPPGVYTANYNTQSDQVSFTKSKITHDELVDLPGTAYDDVMSRLDMFLTPECEARFKKVKLLHKLNILLYGNPGTGKTCIVNRVAYKVIEQEGIVLFNPDPRLLEKFFKILDMLQPDTRVLVIFEELDQLISKYGEGAFLHILDGEVQKHNAMFIATTNYLDKVPARIRRPGRFALRKEVGYPNFEARKHYCMLKLDEELLSNEIARKTENFSIDQLKDVIRAHYGMQEDLDATIEDLRVEFKIPSDPDKKPEPIKGYDEDDEDWEDVGNE